VQLDSAYLEIVPEIGLIAEINIFGSYGDGVWYQIFTSSKSSIHTDHYQVFQRSDIISKSLFFKSFKIQLFPVSRMQIKGLSRLEFYGKLGKEPLSSFLQEKLTECKYVSDFDGNGIIATLGYCENDWINPATLGLVSVSGSADSPDHPDNDPANLISGICSDYRSIQTNNPGITFDFGNLLIKPTKYTLQHSRQKKTQILRTWILDAYEPSKGTWKRISNHTDDSSIKKKCGSASWDIKTATFFSKFRIVNMGANSSKKYNITLGQFEIYGTLKTYEQQQETIFGTGKHKSGNKLSIFDLEPHALGFERGLLYFMKTVALSDYIQPIEDSVLFGYSDSFSDLKTEYEPLNSSLQSDGSEEKAPKKDGMNEDANKEDSENELNLLFGFLGTEEQINNLEPIKIEEEKPKEQKKEKKENNRESNLKNKQTSIFGPFAYKKEESVSGVFVEYDFKSLLLKPHSYMISYYCFSEFKPFKSWKLSGYCEDKWAVLDSKKNFDDFKTDDSTLSFLFGNQDVLISKIRLEIDGNYTKTEIERILLGFEVFGCLIDKTATVYSALHLNNASKINNKNNQRGDKNSKGSIADDIEPYNHKTGNILSKIDSSFVFSGTPIGLNSDQVENLFFRNNDSIITIDSEVDAHIVMESKNSVFAISSYSLRYNDIAQLFGIPKEWSVELSSDGKNWTQISREKDVYGAALTRDEVNSFSSHQKFLYADWLKFTSHGKNSENADGFSLCCINFQGVQLVPHEKICWIQESKIGREKKGRKAMISKGNSLKDTILTEPFSLVDLESRTLALMMEGKEALGDNEFKFVSISVFVKDRHNDYLFKMTSNQIRINKNGFNFEAEELGSNLIRFSVKEYDLEISNSNQIMRLPFKREEFEKEELQLEYCYKGSKACVGLFSEK